MLAAFAVRRLWLPLAGRHFPGNIGIANATTARQTISLMSMAEVRVKINEAIVAQEAGDFATALTKVRSAKLLLVTIPTRSRQGGNRSRL